MAFIDPLKQLALYTRDLLEVSESMIKFGRTNHDKLDFSENLIVIDGLTPAVNIGSQHKYDGANELKTITKTVSAEFALNFYGEDAQENAMIWATLNESQKARNLGYTHKITVHRASGITDLRMLAGTGYTERFEITVKATYNITNETELLRINSSQIDIITDNPAGAFTINVQEA